MKHSTSVAVASSPLEGLEIYPTSWRGPARVGLAIVLLVLGGFLTWSLTAQLASAVVASGSVVVETSRKSVQHLEGGIVRELLVREGDFVRQDEPLVRLDPIQGRAEKQALALGLAAVRARIARTAAEQQGAPAPVFPADLTAAAQQDLAVAEVLRSERELFEARRANLTGERDILSNRIEHAREKLEAMRQEIESTDRQIALVTEELAGTLTLQKKGYAPKTQVLALERERERLRGNASRMRAEIAQHQQAISEAELQILQLNATLSQEAAEELRNAQSELAELVGRETAAEDRVERLELRAPVSGYVVDLTSHGPASVVKPGETLMEIVPEDEGLIVEARVATTDIDSVTIGQRSEIRFTGLHDRNRPPVFGRVAVVSADRLVDEATQTPFYSVRVAVDESEQGKLPPGVFKAGVPAEVMILGAERTLLSYLLDPLLGSLRKAFREE
jgi:HlyD family secretion protein/epimerase transport system membrane fusion protein